MADLTRKQMQDVIENGGSVLHGRHLILQSDQVPSAAELAKGDPTAEAAAGADLKAQIADLQRQMRELSAAKPADLAPILPPPPGTSI